MQALTFSELDGWAADDLGDTCGVYARTLPEGYPRLGRNDPRQFFERNFQPVLKHPAALITGYYEPVLSGSVVATPVYRFPLHRLPEGGVSSAPRAALIDSGCLSGQEIVWLADPLDAYLAQIQGSVRVKLVGAGAGRELRLGYAARNGQPYRSIGAILVARRAMSPERVSLGTIRAWCRANPDAVDDLLRANPSYVFFKELSLPPEVGPIGTSGQPLTPERSLAADPAEILPGSPVWIESDGVDSVRRLFIAQDTGSAITGPARIDLYFGTGPAAESRAGRMKQSGRVVVLAPIRRPWADA